MYYCVRKQCIFTVLGTGAHKASTDTAGAFVCCTPEHTPGEDASGEASPAFLLPEDVFKITTCSCVCTLFVNEIRV